MGRFAAIGGGTFEDTDALNRRICFLSGKEKPNILFIGTAAEDSTNPLTSCKQSFKRVCPGVIVKKLSILRTRYTEEEIDTLIAITADNDEAQRFYRSIPDSKMQSTGIWIDIK